MASGIAKYVGGRIIISIFVLASLLGVVMPVSSHADENDGLPITVQVLTPTTAPAPRTDIPVQIPLDTPIADAEVPIVLVGLEPNSYVEIFANSTPVLIASGFADAMGRFETIVRLPRTLTAGDHSITATNTLSNGTKLTMVVVVFSVSSSGRIVSSAASGGSQGRSTAQSSGSGSVDGGVTAEAITGSADAILLGPDPFNLGGVLYIGGLTSHATYPENLFDPAAEISFAVRNVSTSTVTAAVTFSVNNILGMTVATVAQFDLHELKPGETRVLTANVPNIGQWGAYSAHMKLVPPDKVGNNTLTTLERSDNFFAFAGWSLLALILAITVAGGYALGLRYRAWPTPSEIARRVWSRLPFGHRHHEDSSQEVLESSPQINGHDVHERVGAKS
jgi:hypothetical protein